MLSEFLLVLNMIILKCRHTRVAHHGIFVSLSSMRSELLSSTISLPNRIAMVLSSISFDVVRWCKYDRFFLPFLLFCSRCMCSSVIQFICRIQGRELGSVELLYQEWRSIWGCADLLQQICNTYASRRGAEGGNLSLNL